MHMLVINIENNMGRRKTKIIKGRRGIKNNKGRRDVVPYYIVEISPKHAEFRR